MARKLIDCLRPVRKNCSEMTLGEILRTCRDTLGIKQYKMAQLLGISTHVLKNYELNRFMDYPDFEHIETICEVFELPLKEVLLVIEEQVAIHRKRIKMKSKHPRYVKKELTRLRRKKWNSKSQKYQ